MKKEFVPRHDWKKELCKCSYYRLLELGFPETAVNHSKDCKASK